MSVWRFFKQSKWFGDPMFHFALIAGGLFALQAAVSAKVDATEDIVVDQARIEWLRKAHIKERGQPPQAKELDALIERYVRDEVLFREALALGLQQNDVIVRRRLIEKLNFLIEDVALQSSPGDAELRRLYQSQQAQFIRPQSFSFSHYYFSKDSRADARQDAAMALKSLQQSSASAGRLGDSFMLPYQYNQQNAKQLAASFGEQFAGAVKDLPLSQWSGPVASVYGWHLLRLSKKTAAAALPFEQVRNQVLQLWQDQQRAEYQQQSYQRLRQKYQVKLGLQAGAG